MPKAKVEISDEAKGIAKEIAWIREHEVDRSSQATIVLHDLGFNSYPPYPIKIHLDLLIIKAALDYWNFSVYSDAVLMSLGLLKGYEYDHVPIKKRRKAFLQCSNWLQTLARTPWETTFDDVSETEQNDTLKSFKKTEENYITKLAQYILDHKNSLREYIDNCFSTLEEFKKYGSVRTLKNGRKLYQAKMPYPNFKVENMLAKRSEKANITYDELVTELYEDLISNTNKSDVSFAEPNTENEYIGDEPPLSEEASHKQAGDKCKELSPEETEPKEEPVKRELSKWVSYERAKDSFPFPPHQKSETKEDYAEKEAQGQNSGYVDRRQQPISIDQGQYQYNITHIGSINVSSETASVDSSATAQTEMDDPYMKYYYAAIRGDNHKEEVPSKLRNMLCQNRWKCVGAIGIIVVLYILFFPHLPIMKHAVPVKSIFTSEEAIVLVPGEIYPLEVTVLPKEAENTPLTFSSSDTSVLKVEGKTGMLTAIDGLNGEHQKTVEVRIQADSGVTLTKEVIVREFEDYCRFVAGNLASRSVQTNR